MRQARSFWVFAAAFLAVVVADIGAVMDGSKPAGRSREAAPQEQGLESVPPMQSVEPTPSPRPARLEPFQSIPDSGELAVRRGVFRQRELLTGELVPTRATPITVPRTRAWSVQIRWMAENGTPIEAGDRLIEFDNTSLASDLEDRKIRAVEAADELARTRVEGDARTAEKALAVERARIELEKARLKAEIPEGLLSDREYQDRQLALRRTEVGFAKAGEDLAAHEATLEADVGIKSLAYSRTARDIEKIARDLEALLPAAPEDGIVLVESHPWERRKFSVGDTVWPGMTILTIPDLTSLEVEARLIDVDDGKIAVGLPAICRLDAYPDRAYACRVAEISPVAQASSNQSLRRSFRVRLDLERTDLETMRPGMSVSIEVESERIDEALVVPRAALEMSDGEPRVHLLGGGSAKLELGRCNAQECVVLRGLEEGQRLRLAGSGGP